MSLTARVVHWILNGPAPHRDVLTQRTSWQLQWMEDRPHYAGLELELELSYS